MWRGVVWLRCSLQCFNVDARFSSFLTASREADPGFESRLRGDFSGSSHTSDFKIGAPEAALPGVWRYRVSAGAGRTGVSILGLDDKESLM